MGNKNLCDYPSPLRGVGSHPLKKFTYTIKIATRGAPHPPTCRRLGGKT